MRAALLLSVLFAMCLPAFSASQITAIFQTQNAVEPGTYSPFAWGINFAGSNQCSTGNSWCTPLGCFINNPNPCPYVVATVTTPYCPQSPPQTSSGALIMCSGATPSAATSTSPGTGASCVNLCDGWSGCPSGVGLGNGGCNSGDYCLVGGNMSAYEPPGQYNLCYWIDLQGGDGDVSSNTLPESAGTTNTYYVENAPTTFGMTLTMSPTSLEQSAVASTYITLTSAETGSSSDPLWLEFSNSICVGIGNQSTPAGLSPSSAQVAKGGDGTGLPMCALQSSSCSGACTYAPNSVNSGDCLLGAQSVYPGPGANTYTVALTSQNLNPGEYWICGYMGDPAHPTPNFNNGNSWPSASVMAQLYVTPCLFWQCNPHAPPVGSANAIINAICTGYAAVNSVFLILALTLILLGTVLWTGANTLPGVARGTVQGYAMGMVIAGIASGLISVVAIWLLTTASSNTVSGITTVCGVQEQLTVLASPSSLGTVSGGGFYTAGSQVTITATAINGGTFQGWSGSAYSGSNPTPIIVIPNGPVTETADFT